MLFWRTIRTNDAIAERTSSPVLLICQAQCESMPCDRFQSYQIDTHCNFLAHALGSRWIKLGVLRIR